MAAPKKKKGNGNEVKIPPLHLDLAILQIVGIRPLITHAWDPKVQKQMLGKQMGIPMPKKDKRNPKAEYEAALYELPDDIAKELGAKYGVPAAAFKQSAVDAARHTDLAMTQVVGSFHVRGLEVDLPPIEIEMEGVTVPVGDKSMELIPIYGSDPTMRCDMVRLEGGGSADLRFRPQFKNWHCLVPVQIARGSLTVAQVTDLFNRAGFHCGICEWRPFSKKSKNGSYGMFKVAVTDDDKKLFKKLAPPPFAM
jgi:hypothetical protein